MRTLGIDLASQDSNTALCVIDWGPAEATVSVVKSGVSDSEILESSSRCDVIGIDAPFGWPVPFAEFLRSEARAGASPKWNDSYRDQLRFRQTDFNTKNVLGRWPLSVSSDLIALPAMRCAGLLAELGVLDRSGDGRVYEVYPSASLQAWGLRFKKYRLDLTSMLEQIQQRCSWLKFPDEAAMTCTRNDHAFDALVSSITARCASLHLYAPPDAAEAERARAEGWIAIPVHDSLERLIPTITT